MRLSFITLLGCIATALCFKEQDFKKCNDAGFCKRLRGQPGPKYYVKGDVLSEGTIVKCTLSRPDVPNELSLEARAYAGIIRLTIDERPSVKRYRVQDILLEAVESHTRSWKLHSSTSKAVSYAFDKHVINIGKNPFRIDVIVAGKTSLALNSRDLFAFEYQREKKDDDPPGWWEETFNGHRDSKPKGPQAISLDFTFPEVNHLYGIPEHATSLVLKPTTGTGVTSEPYRLYNLDVFEYLENSPFGLYGSIPLLIAHRVGLTMGALWLNAAEMFVDVSKAASGSSVQWTAENGVVDLFLLLGPTPQDVVRQNALLTGTTAMPQLFALGYHQCRWNYRDEADVAQVDAGFDEHAIPYDVLWLDIEHTDGKRYMTWDSHHFPTPLAMQESVASRGRKMVTIVDPHVKRDHGYAMHTEAEQLQHYVKNRDGQDFDGWCWPGSSSYLDVTSPAVRNWWADQFSLEKYIGSTKHLYIWNDMNEPSVFNGPEITMPKDNIHYGGAEHRDVHNVFGLYYHMATAQGLERRGWAVDVDGDRPFVLSRAFFSGTQRVGPIWTGDNGATWGHLKVSVPMLLTLAVTGLPFSGADVGGFFGNPEAELMVRWYQLGAYYPFFRGHAHLEAHRREPWLFGPESTARIRAAIRSRYTLLPYIYTLFRTANDSGDPVMRPLWYEFPNNTDTFSEEEEFMLGPAMLVRPVLSAGAGYVDAMLPRGARWYDGNSGTQLTKSSGWLAGNDQQHRIVVTLDAIPTMYRGGYIVPRRERPRRSTASMAGDPMTLVVALDEAGAAQGELYLDDGHSYAFRRGVYLHRALSFANLKLTNTPHAAGYENGTYQTDVELERVVVLGLPAGKSYTAKDGAGHAFEVLRGAITPSGPSGSTSAVIVRAPRLKIAQDWVLTLSEA